MFQHMKLNCDRLWFKMFYKPIEKKIYYYKEQLLQIYFSRNIFKVKLKFVFDIHSIYMVPSEEYLFKSTYKSRESIKR